MNEDQKKLWKLGIERLKEIHNAKIAFNLTLWAGKIKGVHSVYDPNYCGTTACAMGYFALMPEFQAEGLQLRKGMKDVIVKTFEDFNRTKENTEFRITMHGRQIDGIVSASELFGISMHQAENCFLPSRYERSASNITALDVANKMESILSRYLQFAIVTK